MINSAIGLIEILEKKEGWSGREGIYEDIIGEIFQILGNSESLGNIQQKHATNAVQET